MFYRMSARAACLESLEIRAMLAYTAHINFQPKSASVPSGYLVDYGQAYGKQSNGLTYGWSSSHPSDTRDRGKTSDQRFDTTILSQSSGKSYRWDLSIPNGTYSVKLVAGDAGYYDSYYKINVEGKLVVNARPNSSTRFIAKTTTITVTDGKLTLSNAGGAINNKICFIDITSSQPPLSNVTTKFFDGVHVTADTDPAKAAAVLRDLGARAIRMWADISWSSRSEPYAFERAREWEDQGFQVTLLLHTSKVPTYTEARNFFSWAMNLKGMKAAVDRWEIINEPNLDKYWQGSDSQYVNNVLKPAWDVFHPAGETVVGGGVSESVSAMRSLVNAGYLNYCDIANVHPYRYTVAQHLDILGQFKSIVGDKPMTATEWNIHGSTSNRTGWAKMLDQAHAEIANYLESAFYYRFVYKTSNTYAGPAGLVFSDMSKHNPFYDIFKNWH